MKNKQAVIEIDQKISNAGHSAFLNSWKVFKENNRIHAYDPNMYGKHYNCEVITEKDVYTNIWKRLVFKNESDAMMFLLTWQQ